MRYGPDSVQTGPIFSQKTIQADATQSNPVHPIDVAYLTRRVYCPTPRNTSRHAVLRYSR